MQNLPATVSYQTIWNLAVSLALQTPDNVPDKDSAALQIFMAAELEDLWRKEAWPELCDNLTQVTLANNVFSKNLGQANEMGDILGIYDQDPRVTPQWRRFEADRIWDGDGQVYVDTGLNQVWVDYQLPCPDLLDPSLAGQNNEAALMAVTLPSRFRFPLAYRGAGLLLAGEDPALSAARIKQAEVELARQASRLAQPWWRTETGKR